MIQKSAITAVSQTRKRPASLSFITISWSFVAAIGLTFFFIQLALWRSQKSNLAPLLAATMTFAACCKLVALG